jgi:hypothetical protein
MSLHAGVNLRKREQLFSMLLYVITEHLRNIRMCVRVTRLPFSVSGAFEIPASQHNSIWMTNMNVV